MGVPTWMYRDTAKGLESAIFDSDELPKGWRDTPASTDRKPAADDSKESQAKK